MTIQQDLFRQTVLIVKVKEPVPEEFELFWEGQTLFTYTSYTEWERKYMALLKG